MNKLTRIVNWLDAHKPSIGFYIGRNPWAEGDEETQERMRSLHHRNKRLHTVIKIHQHSAKGLEELVAATEAQRDDYRARFIKKGMAVVSCIKDNRQLEARVRELEAFVADIRDNYDCDENAHQYQDGVGCRCCGAETLLPKADEDLCEGCEGECSICSTRHEPGSRYQRQAEEGG